MRELASSDAAEQRARWGDLAAVAGKPWLTAVPGQVASVWRHPRWVTPGAVMRYHRGFCIAASCQGTDYLVRYNAQAKQLEFREGDVVVYTARPRQDGAVRLSGAGLAGFLTAETLKYDEASQTLFSDKYELKATTDAELFVASRGLAGERGATAGAAATSPSAGAPVAAAAQPKAAEVDLRAELAAMKAEMAALARQLEQRQAATSGPTSGGTTAKAPAASSGPREGASGGDVSVQGTLVPTPTPAQARAAERRAQREEQARLAEERRQAAQRAAEDAAREKEEQRQAALRAKEEAEERAREEKQARAAEAQRLAEEQKAQEQALVEEAASALDAFAGRVGVAPATAQAIKSAAVKGAPPGKTVQRRYAALAVDRQTRNRYGTARDRLTRAEAEGAALDACNGLKKGCELVVSFSGYACASYRAVDPQLGDAWGLGFASGLPESQRLAMVEGRKYSEDVPLQYEQAWVCNHGSRASPALLFAASREQRLETVQIGAQRWARRNLNAGTFRNGDPIPLAGSDKEWAAATQARKPISRFPQDKPANGRSLGRFYNWFAVVDPRGLCPSNYRVPSKADFDQLIRTVGAPAGHKLKATSGWNLYSPKDRNGTDEFGFTAQPIGGANPGGTFHGVNGVANFWSTTPARSKYAWMLAIYSHKDLLAAIEYQLEAGESVRCIEE